MSALKDEHLQQVESCYTCVVHLIITYAHNCDTIAVQRRCGFTVSETTAAQNEKPEADALDEVAIEKDMTE
jgi:hypothetical protein